ncbi:MAG: ABC transporter permease [Anaerocolumna sp.]
MLFTLYRNRLICLLRRRRMILFTLGVPIVLGLLFHFGLNNPAVREQGTIRIGFVGNENELSSYFKEIINDKGIYLFQTMFIEESEGEGLLNKGDIKALIILEEKPVLYMLGEGYGQTVSHYYFDKYEWLKNSEQLNTDKENTDKENTDKENTDKENIDKENIEKENIEKEKNDETDWAEDIVFLNQALEMLPDRELIFFYNLMVLILLLGARLGLQEVQFIFQENSPLGLRMMSVPKARSGICLSNLLAAFTLHLVGVFLSFFFIIRVLRINLYIQMLPLILISLVTSAFGFSIGIFLCVILKANSRVKNTIMNLIMILGSITAGIFHGNMKYFIVDKFPQFRYINPFILGFDMIYETASDQRLIPISIHIFIMLFITIILISYSLIYIRRRDYAGI